ncbi:hypothetical protein U9Y50_06630, partial [Escherichia coli]|uniref:hypothetical protein n=1 Tax=Escherichia coli TaxID=562 RepID=UPI002FBE77C0
GLTALTAEFTVGEGKLMTHDEPCSMAPDDKHDLISGTCSHLPKQGQRDKTNRTPPVNRALSLSTILSKHLFSKK